MSSVIEFCFLLLKNLTCPFLENLVLKLTSLIMRRCQSDHSIFWIETLPARDNLLYLLADECSTYSLTPPTLSTSARITIACASTFRLLDNENDISQLPPTTSSLTSMECLFVKKKGTLRSSRNARKSVARIDEIFTKVL